MKLILAIALLILQSAAIDEEMRRRHEENVRRVHEIQDSAVKNADGLISREEYGRIIYEIMTIRGTSSSIDYRRLVDGYIGTLPELVNPDKVLEDIGWGDFHKLMMAEYDKHMQASREDMRRIEL